MNNYIATVVFVLYLPIALCMYDEHCPCSRDLDGKHLNVNSFENELLRDFKLQKPEGYKFPICTNSSCDPRWGYSGPCSEVLPEKCEENETVFVDNIGSCWTISHPQGMLLLHTSLCGWAPSPDRLEEGCIGDRPKLCFKPPKIN